MSNTTVTAQIDPDIHGMIEGNVHDEDFNDIENVKVNVLNQENQTLVVTVYSDEYGYFKIENLTAGNYTVEFKKEYYLDGAWTNVSLNENETEYLVMVLFLKDTDGDGVPDIDDPHPDDPTDPKTQPPKDDGKSSDDEREGSYGLGKGSSSFFLLFLILVVSVIVVLVIVFHYTRLKSRRLLEHQTRERLFNHITANPGVHYRGIMNELGLSMGVLTHHLNMLERQQYIKSLQDGPYRRFYPVDMKVDAKMLLNESQEAIIEAIKSNPGISQSQLASNLNMTKKTVYYNVNQLKEAGLVFIDKDGRESECFYAGET